MADAIVGHRRDAGKPMTTAFNTPYTASAFWAPPPLTAASLVGGLVCHDYVDIDVQVTILATVDETGSATLDEIVAGLAGHPKPAGAAFAMVAAGILCIERGIVDANSRLTRALPPGGDDDDDQAPDRAPRPAGGGNIGGSGSDGAPPSAGAMRQIKLAVPYAPAIFSVSGLDRAELRNEPLLRRPGIYGAFWGRDFYAGASNNVVDRVTQGPHLVTPRPADRIIAIVDRTGQLDWNSAQVAERLLHRQLIAAGELKPRNDEPSGGHVDAAEYGRVHDLVEAVMQALRRDGYTSPVMPDAASVPARRKLQSEQTLFATKAEHSAGKAGLYRLDACGVAARARVDDDGWTVLAGSAIRGDVMPSAHPSARRRRIELLHSGGLVAKGQDYLLTQDLSFGSATGAAHFVVGSKTRADIWSVVRTSRRPTRTH